MLGSSLAVNYHHTLVVCYSSYVYNYLVRVYNRFTPPIYSTASKWAGILTEYPPYVRPLTLNRGGLVGRGGRALPQRQASPRWGRPGPLMLRLMVRCGPENRHTLLAINRVAEVKIRAWALTHLNQSQGSIFAPSLQSLSIPELGDSFGRVGVRAFPVHPKS